MKKILTLLALTISFIMNAQLTAVTEGGNTGQRLSTSNASNHGNIGSDAVDLSVQSLASSTRGATGFKAVAMGSNTTASGSISTAIGNANEASGTFSTSMGVSTLASGYGSTSMGNYTVANGWHSTAMGSNTTASGSYSTAIGLYATASDYSSTVIGQHNSSGSSVTNNATSFSTSNTAFVIGNGENSDNKSDAFKVMFDGTTTIAGDLTINSDARLKANITSLGGTLAKLLKIDGKSYTMKKDQSEKQKIGLLAQDIQKVFPELVLESQGIKSVNYQGLVPVIINALKEQDRKMKEKDRKMREQEERLERLERLVANMD